jgi:hypothetical protein
MELTLASAGSAGVDLHAMYGQIHRLLDVNKVDHAERILRDAFQAVPDAIDNYYYAARIAFQRGTVR